MTTVEASELDSRHDVAKPRQVSLESMSNVGQSRSNGGQPPVNARSMTAVNGGQRRCLRTPNPLRRWYQISTDKR
ncbi:hypothetical protein Tco_0767352 [Tanacetum coccineum]